MDDAGCAYAWRRGRQRRARAARRRQPAPRSPRGYDRGEEEPPGQSRMPCLASSGLSSFPTRNPNPPASDPLPIGSPSIAAATTALPHPTDGPSIPAAATRDAACSRWHPSPTPTRRVCSGLRRRRPKPQPPRNPGVLGSRDPCPRRVRRISLRRLSKPQPPRYPCFLGSRNPCRR